MRRFALAVLGTSLALLLRTPAMASVPSPANTIKPAFIRVVGTHGGIPDSAGLFTVIIRDQANNPMPNAQVVVDFGACTDMKLCPWTFPNQHADCLTKTVRGFTDGTGRIDFIVIGEGTNRGGSAGPGGGCANILQNSISLFHPTVNLWDENGAVVSPGVDVTDLSAFLADLGTGFYFGRSDFSGPLNVDAGVLSVVDLSVYLNIIGAGGSVQGCTTTYCP